MELKIFFYVLTHLVVAQTTETQASFFKMALYVWTLSNPSVISQKVKKIAIHSTIHILYNVDLAKNPSLVRCTIVFLFLSSMALACK